MRISLKSPLAGLVLAGVGATVLVTLPSLAADAPGKLYFHSASRSYAEDAAKDPTAWIGGKAPAGVTLDDKAPTKADSATASTADILGLPGSPVAPTWKMPDTGTISSMCVDIWAESATAAETGTLVANLYIQTGDTVVSNGVTHAYASFSDLTVANYAGGVTRMTGLVKTPAPYQLAADTTLNFTVDAFGLQPSDFTLYYDSTKHPSSIAINPKSCVAAALPTTPASASEAPSEEPSEAPSEEPSESPSIEPTVSASPTLCPTDLPSTEPSESGEPSEEPTATESPTSAPPTENPNPVLALVEELTASSAPPSSSAAAAQRAATDDQAEVPAAAECTTPARDTEVAYTGARSGRFGDLATFSATVTDAAGVPASGGTVAFVLGRTTYSAPVGSDGKASIRARLNDAPETYLLETRYSGATGFEPSAAQDGFVIAKAVAVCSLQRGVSPSASSLIGVLSRPDGARVGAATVTFLYNNRSVGTAVTDSRGIARRDAPRGKAGDVFSVAFAGDRYHSACRKDLRA